MVSRTRLVLSAGDWESRLSAHYLRSDGPFGGAPLEHMDATPAEIAAAAGSSRISDLQAQAEFLSCFRRPKVQAWLDGHNLPGRWDKDSPGFFRYLVLTCLVTSTGEGAGDTHNFRVRLGHLLDGGEPLNAVSGVNALWEALARWCEHRRWMGEPVREVRLPSYGKMNLIGYAVNVAFPSWRDRKILTSLLEGLTPTTRRSPRRLAAELRRPQRERVFSTAMVSAIREFSELLGRTGSSAASHRLWRLVESIDERLESGSVVSASRWRIEMTFGGWEHDHVDLRVLDRAREGEKVFWEGPLEAAGNLASDLLPSGVARCLQRGVLVFGEATGASWVLDDVGPATGGGAVVLRKATCELLGWPSETRWRSVADGWLVSERLDPDPLADLIARLGFSMSARDRLSEMAIEGGVGIGRGIWLGRPDFLPHVRAPRSATMELKRISSAADLSLDDLGGSRRLRAPCPLTGRWRLTVVDDASVTDRMLTLEADAPERAEWRNEDVRYEPECELTVHDQRAGQTIVEADEGSVRVDEHDPAITSDLLEAIYCGAGAGWAEGELVETVKRHLPVRGMVWDVLRAHAEADFIEPVQAKRWGARKWVLCPPALQRIGTERAIIRGALGATARRRLAAEVRELGGVLGATRREDWLPDLLTVTDVPVDRLATRMGWSVMSTLRPSAPAAPACWPAEKRSGDGRRLAGVWSFEHGLFVERMDANEKPPIRLERLVRERRDDRDLFRIVGSSGTFTTVSRVVAILEAHRLARVPLFEWREGQFRRVGRSGHLPLPIARALRGSASRVDGPVLKPDGTWTYVYTAVPAQRSWISDILGDALTAPSDGRDSALLDHVVQRRRAGKRPLWWLPQTSTLAPKRFHDS